MSVMLGTAVVVFTRKNFGDSGAGLGFINLSAGLRVRMPELVELTLEFRERFPLRASGTWSTFTSWPGSRGQAVVDGSDELCNSTSLSSL